MSGDEIATRQIDNWLDKSAPKYPQAVLNMVRQLSLDFMMDDSDNPSTWEIMNSILEADNLDAVFAAANAGTTSGKDFIDRPFWLRQEDLQWKSSAIGLKTPGGFPFYWLARVTEMQTGERLVLNCGGNTACGVMFKLTQLDAFSQFGPEGIPLVLKGKAIDEVKAVIIPQLYVLPKPAASPKVVKGETVK